MRVPQSTAQLHRRGLGGRLWGLFFFFESVSNNISLAHAQGNLTLLSVEFAVENSLNHGGLLAPCLPGLVGKDGLNLKRTP